jgi:hypothetical protein
VFALPTPLVLEVLVLEVLVVEVLVVVVLLTMLPPPFPSHVEEEEGA